MFSGCLFYSVSVFSCVCILLTGNNGCIGKEQLPQALTDLKVDLRLVEIAPLVSELIRDICQYVAESEGADIEGQQSLGEKVQQLKNGHQKAIKDIPEKDTNIRKALVTTKFEDAVRSKFEEKLSALCGNATLEML